MEVSGARTFLAALAFYLTTCGANREVATEWDFDVYCVVVFLFVVGVGFFLFEPIVVLLPNNFECFQISKRIHAGVLEEVFIVTHLFAWREHLKISFDPSLLRCAFWSLYDSLVVHVQRLFSLPLSHKLIKQRLVVIVVNFGFTAVKVLLGFAGDDTFVVKVV